MKRRGPSPAAPETFVTSDDSRSLLRHTLATIAYRGGKAVSGAPGGFADFRASETCRTPAQILAHIGDLLDWALTLANGEQRWQNSTPLEWDRERDRFFAALSTLDNRLASEAALVCSAQQLLQGPLADCLSHIGQLAILRRIASAAVRGENYLVADIVAGRVGAAQSPPVAEFD